MVPNLFLAMPHLCISKIPNCLIVFGIPVVCPKDFHAHHVVNDWPIDILFVVFKDVLRLSQNSWRNIFKWLGVSEKMRKEHLKLWKVKIYSEYSNNVVPPDLISSDPKYDLARRPIPLPQPLLREQSRNLCVRRFW